MAGNGDRKRAARLDPPSRNEGASRVAPLATAFVAPLVAVAHATFAVAIATALTALLWPHNQHAPFALFHLAVLFATIHGKAGAGAVSIVLSLGIADYLFLPPFHAFAPASETLGGLGLFAAVASCIVFLVHRNQRAESRLRDREARLSGLVRSAMDAIVVVDKNERITLFNAAAEKMFRCREAEAIGQLLERFIPDSLGPAHALQVERIAETGALLVMGGQRADGEDFPLEAAVSRAAGTPLFTVILRDVSQSRAHEREIERLNRLYAALSHINQAIVRLPRRDELFERACETLVAHGGFCMAWIGWHDPETQALEPVAKAGNECGYLEVARVYGDERPEGLGPCGTAFREGRVYVCNDVQDDPVTVPWRAEMARRGYRASAVIPIRVHGAGGGTLSVYADEAGVFQDKEVALLREVGLDLSFALENLILEEKRLRAEEAAGRFAAIVASTDDAIISRTPQGLIASWNPAAERMFGYRANEIIGQPIDCLLPPDAVEAERHALRTLETGESVRQPDTVRLRKDGQRLPVAITCSPIWGPEGPAHGAGESLGVSIIARDISERKKAEEVLERERRFADNLLETMPGILYLYNEEGKFLRWNRNFEAVSGCSAAEIARMHPLDFFVGEDKARVRRRIADVFVDGESSVEAAFVPRSGSPIPHAFTGKRITFEGATCLVGVGVDISKRKAAEAALQRNQERYRSTIDGILEGCQIIGFDWRYMYLNDAAATHNRRPNEQLIGQRMQDVWPGIDVTQAFVILQRSMEERVPLQHEIAFVFPDGHEGWFDVRAQPVPEGIFVLSIDISERKRAEKALLELNANLELKVAERTRELEAARSRAEAADRLKSSFLATMSHELRTPLNSIIGFTGILLQGLAGPLNAEQSKQLGMVQGSSRHLLELINDVLDISKIEAGQLQVSHAALDLRASVERVIATVKPLAEKKGLVLRVEIPPALGPLESDRRRVDQILLNLLNNAIKFTDRGGVTLSVEAIAAPDLPGASGPVRAARIQVVDTGMGIQPEDLTKLFQPFRQLDSGLERQHEGTGLGLAISRRLTELLGGTIRAESEWGHGSRFTITLPMSPQKAGPS